MPRPSGKAERIRRTERIIARRMPYTRDHGTGRIGRSRKHHPLDCGRTRCWLCHPDKIMDEPKPADERRKLPDEPR